MESLANHQSHVDWTINVCHSRAARKFTYYLHIHEAKNKTFALGFTQMARNNTLLALPMASLMKGAIMQRASN